MLVTALEFCVGISVWMCIVVEPLATVGARTSTTTQLHTSRRTAEKPFAVSV